MTAPLKVSPGRPRVIYITHRVPYPPDKGDRIRNYHLLRHLSQVADVALLCLADESVSAETESELRRLAAQVEFISVGRFSRWVKAGWALFRGRSLSEGLFREAQADATLADWIATFRPDAVVVSASSLVPYLSNVRGIPTFVDVVDVDSQKWFDFAAVTSGPKRLAYRLEGRRVRKLEATLPDRTCGVSLVSRAEADVYESFTGPGRAIVATNGVDLDYFNPQDVVEDEACVFVGALDYLPNVDAAVWFAREVWPAVRRYRPQAEFRIVGRNPAPAVRELSQLPGVRVVGSVPDVRPYVANSAVVVVPMRLSRGLQNKVLEALAMAKATVAAPPALAALAAIPGQDLLSATTVEDWVTAVVDLLGDAARRAELGRHGRHFVESSHDWGRCLAPFTNAIIAAANR
jgi:polysaccharide biosynthesis protein PslH